VSKLIAIEPVQIARKRIEPGAEFEVADAAVARALVASGAAREAK
jgi:hypothetical protein